MMLVTATLSLAHSLTHSLTYSFTHSLTHLLTYSLTHSGNEYTIGTKLHFEIRLKQNDYNTVTSIVTAAEAIVTAIWEEDFNDRLIDALNTFSSKYDKVLTHSLTHALPHSLKHARTNALTHLLTHALTHLLTYLLIH